MDGFVYRKRGKIGAYLKNRKFAHREWKDYKWMISFIVIGLILLGLVYFFEPSISGNSLFGNFASSNNYKSIEEFGQVTLDNFSEYLEGTEFVEDIPKNGLILIYVGETSFIVRKNDVEKGFIDGADLIMKMPEKYLEELGKIGLCPTVSLANENKDLIFETSLTEFELSWKYKGMLKHKDCLI